MTLPEVNLHKDYSPAEFKYDYIEQAWGAFSGDHSHGRYFFIAKLTVSLRNGIWMAMLRRPVKEDLSYVDVPFNYDGFEESGLANIAIFNRSFELGWRIREISVDSLPTVIDEYLASFLGEK